MVPAQHQDSLIQTIDETRYPGAEHLRTSSRVLVYTLEVAGYIPEYDQNNQVWYPGT